MSLNLGTEALEAAKQLHQASGTKALFEAIRHGIHDQVRDKMNFALSCEHEARADAIGYARALRDVFMALEAGALGVRPNAVEKPSPAMEARRAAR